MMSVLSAFAGAEVVVPTARLDPRQADWLVGLGIAFAPLTSSCSPTPGGACCPGAPIARGHRREALVMHEYNCSPMRSSSTRSERPVSAGRSPCAGWWWCIGPLAGVEPELFEARRDRCRRASVGAVRRSGAPR